MEEKEIVIEMKDGRQHKIKINWDPKYRHWLSNSLALEFDIDVLEVIHIELINAMRDGKVSFPDIVSIHF